MRKADIFLLAVMFFAVTFPTSFYRDLWEPDEPRFALVAREMIETGNFVMPHRNGKPYPDKPPFYFWTIAGASRLTGGINTAAALMPTAAAGAIALILTFLIAVRLGADRRTAFMAAVILATSVKWYWQATHAQIDMVLACLTSVALLGLVRWETGGGGKDMVLAWAAMGVATLAKGPVGFIIPLGAAVVWRLWLRRPIRPLFHRPGILAFLLVVFSWLGLLVWQGLAGGHGDYLENILFKQTVVRFAKSWHHHHGVTYFLQALLYDFFPWSFFLLASGWLLIRRHRENLDDGDRILLSIVGFTLAFFSIPMGKRGLYILPLYPAAAILTARWLQRWGTERPVRWADRLVAVFFIGIGATLAIRWHIPVHGVTTPVPTGWIGLWLLATGGIGWFSHRRMAWIPAGMLGLFLFTGFVAFPALNERNSARPFVVKNMTWLQPDSRIAIAQYRSAHVLYGDRKLIEFPGIDEADNIAAFVAYLREHPDHFGIVSWEWVVRLKQMGIPVQVLNRRKVGNKDLCFIRIRQTGDKSTVF